MCFKKYSFFDIKNKVEESNETLLTEEKDYVNVESRIKTKCNICNKIREISANDIVRKRKSRCMRCVQRKHSKEYIIKFANDKNIKILNEEDILERGHDLKLKCMICQFEWKIIGYEMLIQNKTSCRSCSGKLSYTYEQVFDCLKQKDIVLLSNPTEYKGHSCKLRLRCGICEHKWKTTFIKIKNLNTGCPKCAGNIMKTTEEIRIIIEKKGGMLLSDYTGANNKITIKCNKCEKIWSPTYSSIRHGSWCPACALHKTQRFILNIIKEIFPKKVIESNFNGFDWLKTSKYGKQQIDIWVPELKLAIEYDGEQHFFPVCFNGIKYDEATFVYKNTKKLDKIKNIKIKEHKNDVFVFVRFNYKEIKKLNKEYIVKKLQRNGVII